MPWTAGLGALGASALADTGFKPRCAVALAAAFATLAAFCFRLVIC